MLRFIPLLQDEDLKRKDRDEWTGCFEKMRDLLKEAADLSFDAGKIGGQTKEKYAMSGMIYKKKILIIISAGLTSLVPGEGDTQYQKGRELPIGSWDL